MTPEYIEELAQLVDPDELWRASWEKQMEFTLAQKRQMDTAVALRRYAMRERELAKLREQRRSLLITPLSPNHTAVMSVETPEDHERLRGPHHEAH